MSKELIKGVRKKLLFDGEISFDQAHALLALAETQATKIKEIEKWDKLETDENIKLKARIEELEWIEKQLSFDGVNIRYQMNCSRCGWDNYYRNTEEFLSCGGGCPDCDDGGNND